MVPLAVDRHWPLVRDVASFGVGAYVVIIALQSNPRDATTMAFGAMLMGVPAALGLKKNGKT